MFNPKASFALARQLRSAEGAPLGEVFSFVSGLYFRGKMTYAQTFGRGPESLSPALVISPAEGLRFLHEPVTLERLAAWAKVDIDANNPRFTEPLVAHAAALERAHGGRARFVLLGSVASDKYVAPLTRVFRERLLFPPEFVGRGDMSRGSLLLHAARANSELDYAPVMGSELHGPRPAPRRPLPSAPAAVAEPQVVLLMGLPGAGKSSFYRERFASSHVHLSQDELRPQGRAQQCELELLQRALGAGRSAVIDDTNVSPEQRAPFIARARRAGARVIGYFFDAAPHECVVRNQAREGRARVPAVAIFAAAKRLVEPSLAEGFDELHVVRALPEQGFEVEPASGAGVV